MKITNNFQAPILSLNFDIMNQKDDRACLYVDTPNFSYKAMPEWFNDQVKYESHVFQL